METMDDQIAQLLALAATVVALSAGYAKAFGAYQCQIVQWVIDAGRVPGRFRGVVNLAVGVAIAAGVGGLGARQAGDPGILVLGLLAGILASVEAAKVHDAQSGRSDESVR
jgi:hypothetical protein